MPFHPFWVVTIGGCQYYQWEDEMVDTGVQTPHAPAPIHTVPLQAVAPPGGFPTTPLPIRQDQATGVDIRVMQQLKWLEKMVYVCIFLTLYAIFKK
uniref:Uncharacterized protein n=1 Tax=Oryza sativa subsp. japonica TaxID=39947 RepID=Q6K799_ORYSJ|nr:hypothetical protein [Oryza sativa Japonica Group]BAD19583.1 hypothetical protein [Oryza sativa Japonica Group]